MTADEAFAKFMSSRSEYECLPWEVQASELRPVFMAGWHAHIESCKQEPLVLTEPEGAPPIPAITPEVIYSAWPVKKARGAAIKAITKAVKKVNPPDLLDAVKAYSAAVAKWPRADMQFVPLCSTWMNQERWADDRQTWTRGGGAGQQPQQFTRRIGQ